jgi:acetolactate synthase-1/2/3 large subunit
MTGTTDEIVELFEAGGVDTVFGFPCEQMDPYYSSLADSSLRHVLGRSEASAALMADGYARANRTVGVVDGVGGPGAAYMSAGLCEADGASSPVLALTGDNERDIRGRERWTPTAPSGGPPTRATSGATPNRSHPPASSTN